MSQYREEIIGDCRLILGDCLTVMPTLGKVDVIVTDPIWPNAPDDMFPGINPYDLFAAFCRLLPADLRQLVICMRNDSDPRFLSVVPKSLPFQQCAFCHYVMPGYIGRMLGGSEIAYAFGSPVKYQKGRTLIPSISPKAQPSHRPPNGHPCSRALIHQRWLTNWYSDIDEIVLDPFMGSGTTGVACVELGRKFIGIEIDEKYFDIACEQISRAERTLNLFVRQKLGDGQEGLW